MNRALRADLSVVVVADAEVGLVLMWLLVLGLKTVLVLVLENLETGELELNCRKIK